ncbi:carboxymuconolactone decarboxylase family protein [Kitasatospora sp. NPDC127067]|uniref:carboxymuconolactone decarboxylase family protein n=1 Tax=Kitasatospora sp. NPDC127067 TaxID=3347126 RepID=UPI003660FAB8
MSRVPLIDPATATGPAAEALRATRQTLGVTNNMAKALANSPAALTGFLGLHGALKAGVLSPEIQERIALAVSEANGCTYCLSAHTLISRNVVKLPEEEIAAARRGESSDPKAAAVLRLALAVTRNRGPVDEAEIAAAREAGLTDTELVEVIAHVAHSVFTNYVNEALDITVEWPIVRPLERQTAQQ